MLSFQTTDISVVEKTLRRTEEYTSWKWEVSIGVDWYVEPSDRRDFGTGLKVNASRSSKAEICCLSTSIGSRMYIVVCPTLPSGYVVSTEVCWKPLLWNIFSQLLATIFLQSDTDLILSRKMLRSKSLLWKKRNNWFTMRMPAFLATMSKNDASSSRTASAGEPGSVCSESTSGTQLKSEVALKSGTGGSGLLVARVADWQALLKTDSCLADRNEDRAALLCNLHLALWPFNAYAESVLNEQNGHRNSVDDIIVKWCWREPVEDVTETGLLRWCSDRWKESDFDHNIWRELRLLRITLWSDGPTQT